MVFKIGKTDEHRLQFSDRLNSYPIVPGHEISGIVQTLGAVAQECSELTEGDRVVVYPWIGCGSCGRCSAGDDYLCSYSEELGFRKDGGYGEYVVVSHFKFVVRLPSGVPYDVGAILTCGGITAFSAVKKSTSVASRVGKWQNGALYVMVIGLGGLGRWALNILPHVLKGFHLHVTGVDLSLMKVQAAKEDCGNVDDAFEMPGDEPVIKTVERFKTNHHRPNIVLDFVNSSRTFSFSTSVLSRAGVHVMVGLHGGLGELMLPVTVIQETSHQASYVGSLQDMKDLLELVDRQGVRVPHIETYNFCDAMQVLKKLEEGKVNGRAVLIADSQ